MNIVYLLVGLNLITFMLYGVDKYKARKKRWRISEKVLLWCSFCGGSIGGVGGMLLFHHKTRKWYFWFVNSLGFCILIFIVYQFSLKNFTFK